MASLSWIDKGRGGSPLWWAGPKTYMALVVCSASTAHTGLCHSSPPNIPESTATVSNRMCKHSVHMLFKTLLNFWWRWGFLPAAACRRAGLGSQSSPGSLKSSPCYSRSMSGSPWPVHDLVLANLLGLLQTPGLPTWGWGAPSCFPCPASITPAQLGKRQCGDRSKPQTSIPTRNQQLGTSHLRFWVLCALSQTYCLKELQCSSLILVSKLILDAVLYCICRNYSTSLEKGGGGEGRPLPQQLGLQDRGMLSFPAGWIQELYMQYHPSSQAYHTCIKLLIRSISRLFQHHHGRVPHAHTLAGRAMPYSLSRGEAASSAWFVSQHLAVKLGSALKKVGEMLRTGSPLHAAPQGTDGLSPCNKWVIALFALNS